MTHQIKRSSFVLFAAICLGVAVNAQVNLPSENKPNPDNFINVKDVPNLYKVNSNLYRGGQPTEEGLRQLKKLGIKTIIDLRDNDIRAKKEESWAHSVGLGLFINTPLSNWFGPRDETIDGIIKLIDRPENQPVFVHCKRGSDRTGTVIAVYRITHDGWTGKQANAEAKQFGFGWWQFWMKDFINDYYRDFKAKGASKTK